MNLDPIGSRQVAVYRLDNSIYPCEPPFNPSEAYPEYQGEVNAGESNPVYGAVRESLRLLGLDGALYGTEAWNPLSELIRPGDRVVLKPNFLSQGHGLKPEEWQQIITHGSVIRALLDYVLLALEGEGTVHIIDGPQYDADWDKILENTGTRALADYCASRSRVAIELLDLRDYQQEVHGDVICRRHPLPSDPRGGVEIDLGELSAFSGHDGAGRYYGSDYDQGETNRHHSNGRHEYRISRTAASADVFINLPKLKTHKKVGVTLSLKNLVGINVGRNWLPHHTDGDPSTGGDQFPWGSTKTHSERMVVRWLQQKSLDSSLFASLFRMGKIIGKRLYGRTDQVIRHGNWHGNDTAWRMVLDINRCLLYDNRGGCLASAPKRYFSLVDGVIGGQGDGPACAEHYPSGLIIAGLNPVAVDCAAARLMGFDPLKIPLLRRAFDSHPLPLVEFPYEAISLVSNFPFWNGPLTALPPESTLHFKAHFGWAGEIEFKDKVEGSHGP